MGSLTSFCDQRQLTLNLSKTQMMISDARHSHVADLVLNSAAVEKVESLKYLGFTFHGGRDMSFGAGILSTAAKKPVFVMRRQYPLLSIRESALHCKLLDTLVLPILSYAVE